MCLNIRDVCFRTKVPLTSEFINAFILEMSEIGNNVDIHQTEYKLLNH